MTLFRPTLFLIALGFAAPVLAQTVANPTTLVFNASADHFATAPVSGELLVTGYTAKYFPLAACNPQCPATGESFTITLGKPTPSGGVITVTNIFGGIVLNSIYKAVVEAVGPGGVSRSLASNPFGRETVNPPATVSGTPVVSRQ